MKLEKSVDSALKENLVYTIQEIKKLIKARDIKGVHGLFIDLIEIDPDFHMACDLTLKNKLFGFVVDDYQTAETILQLNREVKGSIIQVYPLDWVKDLQPKRANYPSSSEAVIVRDHIK